uniref:Kelch-like protein diablo n=1 Tax=Clastoptera arizonana TaxID=38151 RepID=A0A1B6CBD2_9HEMI
MAVEICEDLHYKDVFWPQHFVLGLSILRDLNIFHDVQLIAEGKKIPAHRVILAASSVYFRGMFCTGLKESSQNEIPIHDVDYEALEAVVNFFYTAEIKLTENNIYPVAHIVDLFGITSLRSVCSIYLMNSININNCVNVCIIAKMYNYLDVYNAALYHACKNFDRLLDNDDFMNMSYETLIECLSSHFLNLPDENKLLLRLCGWVKQDYKNRIDNVQKLLDYVNIYLLDFSVAEPALLSLNTSGNFLNKWLDKSYRTLLNKEVIISSRNILRHANELEVVICIGGFSPDIQLRTIDALKYNTDIWRCMIPSAITQGTKLEPLHKVIPALKYPRMYTAVAQRNNFVFIIGGRNNANEQINSVDIYDVSQNEWVECVNLPEPIEGAAAACINGAIYVTGGFNNESGVSRKTWVLEKNSKTWREKSPMNEQRSYHGLVAVNEYLYALGGAGKVGECSSTMERYNIKTETWQIMSSFQKPRSHFGCVSLDNNIYVIGGCTQEKNVIRSVQMYNTLTGQWQSCGCQLPLSMQSFGATVRKGKIFIAGGNDGSHVLNFAWEFNPNAHFWNPMPSLNKGRIGLILATIRVPQV